MLSHTAVEAVVFESLSGVCGGVWVGFGVLVEWGCVRSFDFSVLR